MTNLVRHAVFVSAVICFTTTSSANAQRRADSTDTVPGPLAVRIAADVAAQWGVEARRVVLEWNRFGDHDLLTDSTTFQLRGQSTGTHFSVVFSPVGHPPVAAGLRAGLLKSVPVATRTLTRGDIVEEADVVWDEDIVWGRDALSEALTELPVGWTVRTNIGAGERVSTPVAVAPPAVQAGEAVEVVWERGLVVISQQGTALNSAAIGERVRIRLNNRRGNARGIAVGTGRVRLVEHS